MNEPRWRRASAADAVALLDVERAANLDSLGHVFPPDRFPYPTGDVLARWTLVLEEPDCVVEVIDGEDGRLACVSAYDATSLRHLVVRPDLWGTGLGRAGVERAVQAIRAQGSPTASLWCLADNKRARGLYEHLGWRATGVRRAAPWPPYPTEIEYVVQLRP